VISAKTQNYRTHEVHVEFESPYDRQQRTEVANALKCTGH